MIEDITIVTKGGLVLWNHRFFKLRGTPINDMIKNVLLEERTSEKKYEQGSYIIEWILDNSLELIFVVVYQKNIQIPYAEELLKLVKQRFIELYKDEVMNGQLEYDFEKEFQNIITVIEKRHEEQKKNRKQRQFQKKDEIFNEKKQPKKIETPREPPKQTNKTTPTTPTTPEEKKLTIEEKRAQLRQRFAKKTKQTKTQKEPEIPTPVKRKKKMRESWTVTYSEEEARKLDKSFSNSKPEEIDVSKYKEVFMKSEDAKVDLEMEIDDSVYELKQEEQKKSGLFSYFQNLTGGKVLTREDLLPVMEKFKRGLQEKNVAGEIADQICESVIVSLIGKKTGTFTTIYSTIRQAMEETLTRILTPKRNIDIIREVMNAREQHRPYSIVFCGVNGVGKSTSLAKICFWLKQNGLKVLIAACDTFRSGAVEQLKVHAECLKIELFQQGYGKDTAALAKQAIEYAKANKFDVVMIDTAGRMQDNEPLMRALNKLILVNKPDLVLFVGEALVGNDGVDQLIKFNQALSNVQSHDEKSKLIDGIVLTKFDTVDDKVGTAVSMVYLTGHPILFVGVGQTYTDLKKLSPKAVVQALMK